MSHQPISRRERLRESLQPSALERLTDRIDALPDSTRPIAYGAALLVLMIGGRRIIVLPLFAFYLVFKSHSVLADLETFAIAICLAILGGALSGLSYSLLGRHVVNRGSLGRYVAGITTVFPYMVMVDVIDRVAKLSSDIGPLGMFDVYLVAGLSVLFGVPLFTLWFGNTAPPSPEQEQRRILKLLGGGVVLISLALWYASSCASCAR